MKRRAAVLAFTSSFLAAWTVPSFAQTYGESPYIFGMHEPGGEGHMADKGRKGWILFTEELGHDAGNSSGGNYRPWADGGFGILVRLNHGYGTNGTLPYERHYDAFAQRVANFVANAPGSHIWVVGNEPNLAGEWPAYEGAAEPITPQRYASAFRRVRDRIKALPGHAGDQVLMAGMSPASSGFTYHTQTLAAIGAGNVDGFAIHCYTAGSDPARIQQEFRDYRRFLDATPTWARSLPAYITETDEGGPWTDANTGWVKAAYAEIDAWNRTSGNQQVRSLVLYRWPRLDAYYIDGKNGVITDWREAMSNDYRWGVGGVALDADVLEAESVVPTSMVAGETRDVVVRVLNKGTSTWGAGSAVRLGTLASNTVAWSQFPCGGYANGLADGRAFLCADVAPGATGELRFKITAPGSGPATFGARMVKDGVQWFGDSYTVAIAISSAGCIQTVPGDHWKGEYFANTGLSGSPSLVRDDGVGALAFDWGTGGPNSCGVGVDRFSARWSRTMSFDAGTWRFTATVDDGVRLYVDGQLRINAWIDQAPKSYSADVVLAAGSHSVVMEYYENAGGAVASLAWTKVGGGTTASKLSLHSGGGSLSMQFVSDTRPPVVKLLDDLGAAAEIKQRSPGTRIIARIYEASQPQDGDPGQRAQEWWSRNRDRILGAPAVDYWEGYNEPGVGELAQVQWYAQFEAARVNVLAENGRKACIGNFSTGTPDVNEPAVWPAFYPAIDAAMAHGGILGLHEYGTPMQQHFEGDVASGLGWLCGRYRRVYQGFLVPDSRVLPLAITETGVDGACPGWQSCYDEAQYLDQLKWYDGVLRQDAYVLGAAIFQLEIPGWYAFDISPLMPELTEYVRGQQGPPPANHPPAAVIDASPASGVAPLTVQFDGSGSSDPDGDALSFSWSFGDGQQASEAQVSHTYGASGSFTVTLAVGDGKGGNATASTTITVSSPPSGNLVTNGDFSQGLNGWTPWRERGAPTASASSGQLRVSGGGYNGGVYQRFATGGAGTTVTIGGFWATDPAVASAQWGEVLVIDGARLPIDGQDVAAGQADVVLVYKNDTWASPSGWSGGMSQTAPVAHLGSFVAAGAVATIVLKSGNVPGVTTGVRFDDILVSNGGVPANRPPTAVVSASPTSGPAPLTVQFDGAGSSDPDGDALRFAWSFGDGSQASGAQVSHTYGADGSFTATLTASDGRGGTGSQSVTIAVGWGPVGLQWDDRLTRLGVTLVPARVTPGQGYWRLVKAAYEDDGEVLPGPCNCSESGGNHHVFYKVLRADGTPIENQKCVADWPNPAPTSTADVYTKGADPLDDYWGNFPLVGHPSWCPYYLDGQGPRGIYGASVAGAPSDKVWGMDLPCSHHVNFRFTWQWTVAD
jgi:PKD repeat protein